MASSRQLPRDGVHPEFPKSGGINDGQETEVDAHEEVCHAQVADEKSRYIDFGTSKDEDENDGSVAEEGHEEDDPDSASQAPPIEQILTWHEGT